MHLLGHWLNHLVQALKDRRDGKNKDLKLLAYASVGLMKEWMKELMNEWKFVFVFSAHRCRVVADADIRVREGQTG